jgi:hypothetical protein
MSDKTLIDYVNQAKARWLQRVMYASLATSTQKVLAYAISDHLNCVTLDSWPAQSTLSKLLGRKCEKTISRSSSDLSERGFLTIRRGIAARSGCRYAPLLLAKDWDRFVDRTGQKYSQTADTDVPQSSLSIQLESSSGAFRIRRAGNSLKASFNLTARGAIELKLAEKLGADGLEILGLLASIDDAIVMRLCQAYVEDLIGKREVTAARLAAKQAR